MIYLDNAATTLKKPPCVAEAVVRAMATMGNSGRSAHQEALDASRVIYRTREQLARLLGCSAAERVVFTCNSTEALNIAIDGLFAPGDHVLSTDCEHNSVLRPLYRLEGVEVDFLPADRRGCIDYDDFRRLLRPNTRGIVCTHGSNLTGNLLDIRAIGRFAKEHGKRYEDLNLIVVHMGGGVSVGAHLNGRIVDVNNALDGEGAFSPERAGGVPSGDLVKMCFSGKYTQQEVTKKLVGNGGFNAYIGSNDARDLEKLVQEGDEHAKLVQDAFHQQVAKDIGAMSTVLCGKVDQIILTGGIAYSKHTCAELEKRAGFIAPFTVYPGEDELLALAQGALRVMNGEEEPMTY